MSKRVELGVRGSEFWASLHEEFEYDSHTSELVFEACRVLDVIDSLQVSIADDGVMVAGSQGQLVVNGAVAELRQQQAILIRLIQNLGLDDEGQSEVSRKAQMAAQARWRNQKKRSS